MNVTSFCSNISTQHPIQIVTHKTLSINIFSYVSVSTYATVPENGVEIVNFTLTRISLASPVQDPSVKEFENLIKQLSGESGLDELIKNTPTQSSFRYRRYSEVSEFLRGLTLNFPEITSLHRYSTYIMLSWMFIVKSSFVMHLITNYHKDLYKPRPCFSVLCSLVSLHTIHIEVSE